MPHSRIFLLPDDLGKVPLDGASFFYDANIWLRLFSPVYSDPKEFKVKAYSALHKNVLQSASSIYIDITVLSEFINRYLRECQVSLYENNQLFKLFRQTDEYEEISSRLSDELFHMLADIKRVNTDFEGMDLDKTVADFSKLGIDFNDVVIRNTCRSNKFVLVTDDADCCFDEVGIITANRILAAKLGRK